MMVLIDKVLYSLSAYLLGSVPFGLLYSLYIEGDDLRKSGSGNIGATNVLRNFGWIPGISVLCLDAAKGAVPVLIAINLNPESPILWTLTGVFSIIGHIFPVFISFDGGKGVATSAGVFGVLLPISFIIAISCFGILVGLTRYMSVGSLTGAFLLPIVGGYLNGFSSPMVIAAVGLAILVILRHQGNIRRLINGNEEKFF